jgi:surface antigen
MFNDKVSAVKSWMVVGKLLVLIISTPVLADTVENPRFFQYTSGTFINRLVELSFGWFSRLNEEQSDAYQQSLTQAVMFAENGQPVRWYKGNASGVAVPVITWPVGSGYCRRIHIQAIAHNAQRTMTATACFDNASTNWQWIRE